MFVCTTVLYEYMNSLRNGVYDLFVNTHVWIKIYREFYHGIIYIAKEGRHVRIMGIWYNLWVDDIIDGIKDFDNAEENIILMG